MSRSADSTQSSTSRADEGRSPAAWPRVLVLSANPFNTRTNNGLTLSSLFAGWPTNAVAQVFVPFATPIPVEADVCKRFWKLTPTGLRLHVPTSPTPPRSPPLLRRMILMGAESPAIVRVVQPLREAYYSSPALWTRGAREDIRRFAPEVVFSTLGSLSLVRMALRLARELDAAIVPFVTDDWPETEYASAIFGAAMRRALLRDFTRILEMAPVRMVISPSMARAYTERYGGSFEAFTQCIDAERFNPSPPPRKDKLRFVYAGQLGLGRWQQLQRVGTSLAVLRNEGVDAELVIYSSPSHLALHGDSFRGIDTVRVGGHVGSNEIPAIYRDADVLVHVESFAPESTNYIRYSMSTKLTEYMMAARPILGFGPDVGSLQYVRDIGAGVVVNEDSDDALRCAVGRLVREPVLRRTLSETGRAHALQHHEAQSTRARFRELLVHASQARHSTAVGR